MSTTAPEDHEIDLALRAHLTALATPWSTKLPGIAFAPGATTAYQILTWMPGQPMRVAMGAGAYHRVVGVCQIDIFYPKSERRVDLLWARARAVRDHFYPPAARGLAIDAGAGQIIIEGRPSLSPLDESNATHNRLIVSVVGRIEMPPAS